MKSDVVLLSHYDLDGAGCSVLTDHIWNVVDRKHQGYGKIRKSLGYLIGEYYGKVGTIVIADLKMERADLELALFAFPRVIYYDHHESSADFEDIALVRSDRQFQFNFSTDYCSTALMWMDGVKNWGAERTPTLDAFMNAVNTYDLWKTDAKRWEQGVMLNDLFWHLHMDDFRRRFANGLTGFSEDERDWHAQLMNQRKYVIENAIIEEMDSGSKVVVLQEQNGINYVADYIEGDLYYTVAGDLTVEQALNIAESLR